MTDKMKKLKYWPQLIICDRKVYGVIFRASSASVTIWSQLFWVHSSFDLENFFAASQAI